MSKSELSEQSRIKELNELKYNQHIYQQSEGFSHTNLEYLRLPRLEDRDRANIIELQDKVKTLSMLVMQLQNQNASDLQMLYDVARAIIQGIKGEHSEKEVLDQIKLVLDKEAQQSIIEGRKEIAEGKTKSFDSIEDFIKSET